MHHIATVLPRAVLLPFEDGIIGIFGRPDFAPEDRDRRQELAAALERFPLRVIGKRYLPIAGRL